MDPLFPKVCEAYALQCLRWGVPLTTRGLRILDIRCMPFEAFTLILIGFSGGLLGFQIQVHLFTTRDRVFFRSLYLKKIGHEWNEHVLGLLKLASIFASGLGFYTMAASLTQVGLIDR